MGRQGGNTGWVAWPRLPHPRWTDSGEGGMWVHGFWPCDFTTAQQVHIYDLPAGHELADRVETYYRDPFIRCHGPQHAIALPLPDAVTSHDTYNRIYDDTDLPDPRTSSLDYQLSQYERSVPVLAAVCLGTTGTAYIDSDTGAHWQCGPGDLTEAGSALADTLTRLYGRDPVLVTYLDT